jgi:hypothetical protein
MAQYRNGYAFFTDGSNIVTSSGGAIWNDSIIQSGSSVLTLERNVGFYFINSVEGPLYEEPYIDGNASGCYKIHLSAPYEAGLLSSSTGYLRYAITNSFTPNLGLPLVEKGDINTAALFSSALYKLDQVYHGIQLTGAAYVNPLLDVLQQEFQLADENLLALINQLSGNYNDSKSYSEDIYESGQYLLNYIDSIVAYFSGEFNSTVSSIDNKYNNVIVGVTGLSNRILNLENISFNSGDAASNLTDYCYELITTVSGDLELSIYNQLQDLSGGVGENPFTEYRLDSLEAWRTGVVNENYSSKITSLSGNINARLISSGQSLYTYYNQLSGNINSLSSSVYAPSYGTTSNSYYIGSSIENRILLKNNTGVIEIKNGNDSVYEDIKAGSLYLINDIISFSDGQTIESFSNNLYYGGEIMATQDWVTGNLAIFDLLEERVSILESGTETHFNYALSPYGRTSYQIPYGKTFPTIPYPLTQLCANGTTDPVIAFYAHDFATSSFYVTFASEIPTSNYSLTVFVK